MKLISKYNRVNIIATVIVLLLSSICYYYIVRYILIHQLDDSLRVEEAEILDYAKNNNRLPVATNYKDQHINFEATDQLVRRKFRNIRRYDSLENERDPYRQLTFPVTVNGKFYKATVTKSEMEVEYLVGLIVLTTGIIVLLLFLILFIANRLLLRKIWKPFYELLQSIKQFNLLNKKYTGNVHTNIDEFRDLDNAVNLMTSTIIKDYETLKNFSDNASHEMQTPLAVINSKLDLLIQEPNLGNEQVRQVQAMYDAVGRLTRLNQSLLLLTKIENNQFTKAESIRLDLLIKEKLLQLEDLAATKHLKMDTVLDEVTVKMDDYLADILLNNLFNNAIRHNIEDGLIKIELYIGRLIVSNTGPAFNFNASHIFDRFKKADHSEGIGLGLAIVKQICDNYQFRISYNFQDQFHVFTILFES